MVAGYRTGYTVFEKTNDASPLAARSLTSLMLPKIQLVLICDLLRLEYAIQSQTLLFRETRARRRRDAAIELHTVAYLNSVAHFSRVTIRRSDMRIIRRAHDGGKTFV